MSLMTIGCRLNWFYGRVINPGSVVNGLASTLWLDSEIIKEVDTCHMFQSWCGKDSQVEVSLGVPAG